MPHDAGREVSSSRGRQVSDRKRWLGVALVVLAGALPLSWVIFARIGGPSDGTTVFPSSPPWGPAGVVVQEVHGDWSPLRPGDRVLGLTPGSQSAHVGDRLTYHVVRDGSPIDVEVTLHPYPLGDVVRD